ncbi:hypothetical protein [Hyalangium gracile]|uniref:hypothetical protein n=1 Tax=Hyalangium gracile TaxID=394092 RepID=UPI001CCBB71E|nr:hypothetical protein [Hyalangium gracile]
MGLKVALLFGGTWLGSLAVSVLCTGIAAAATSSWSASRVGGVMFLVMAMDVAFALAGSLVLWRGLSSSLQGAVPRITLMLGHGVLQLATAAVLILMTFVAFNR